MSENHITDLLSSYIDNALSESDRRRVDAHAEKCKDCRKELTELQKVSHLVASLPQHDLPPGFLTRLQSRRRREEAKTGFSSLWPMLPARSAALALTGFFACIFFFREISDRLAPSALPDAISSEMDQKIAEEFKYEAASEPHEEAAPLEKKDARPNALRAPIRGQQISSNAALRNFLDAESRRMGIREVLPPSHAGTVQTPKPAQAPEAPPEWEGIPNRPMSREEARTAMQRMTRNLYQINQRSQWKRAPTVPLDGKTPKIIHTPDDAATGGKMIGAAEKTPIPTEALGDRSIAFTGKNAEGKYSETAAPSSILLATRGASKHTNISAPADTGRILPQEKASSPPASLTGASSRTLSWEKSWSSTSGGLGTAGGAVITNAQDWSDMHRRIRFTDILPTLDFSRQMAVGLFGGKSPSHVRSVKIASITEDGQRLLIRYKTATAAAGASSPYHIVIVPKSDLPPAFIQIP